MITSMLTSLSVYLHSHAILSKFVVFKLDQLIQAFGARLLLGGSSIPLGGTWFANPTETGVGYPLPTLDTGSIVREIRH